MGGWRYVAQHPTSGEFLEWELPLADVALTRRLSGPWGLTAKIEPEVARLRNDDGSLLLNEWGVQIWADDPAGTIRGGGILTSSRPSGPKWELTCEGHARYPYGIPYTGRYRHAEVDPLDAVREVWRHLQAFSDGDLGLVVDDLSSPVRIGGDVDSTTNKAEPYDLAWWDAVDCGEELEALAKETPFEFVEAHAWAGETIEHRLRLGYPRLGRKRSDIGFVEGENVTAIPQPERDGETFAQYVLGLGTGEGRRRLRVPAAGRPDGRLRRVHVLDRPDVRSASRLSRLTADEQAIRSKIDRVPELLVRDHPNAPLGSWALGDTIDVELRTGWAAGINVACRIVEEVIAPKTGDVALRLTRADGL